MNTTVDGRTRVARQRWAICVAAWMLSGCGGGGGGTTENNINIPKPVTASTDTSPGTNAQTAALVFGMQRASGSQAERMVAVDPSTAQVVWSQSTDKLQSHSFAYEQVIDSTGAPQAMRAARQLIYVYDHRVYGLALTPRANVQAHQISGITDACHIQRVFESGPSGLTAWVVVTKAGPDQTCDSTDHSAMLDNPSMLVNTSYGVADHAIDYPFDTTYPTLPITNSQGLVTAIVGLHVGTGQLGVIKADGAVEAIANSRIDFPFNFVIYGRVPDQTTQAYVRMGYEIKVLDWSQSSPTLSATGIWLSSNYGAHVSDPQYLYIADGDTLKRLDGNGQVTTVTTKSNPIGTLLQTPDYVVFPQYLLNHTVDWYAVAKKTGQTKLIYNSFDTFGPPMKVATGNVLLRQTPVNDMHLTSSITRFDLDKGTSELVDREARNIFPMAMAPVALDTNSRAISHLLLCHVDASTGACPAGEAFIYDVQANTRRHVASSNVASSEPGWSGFDFNFLSPESEFAANWDAQAPIGPHYLLSTFVTSGGSTTSKLWMFDPSVEGSLTLVP